MIIFNDSISGRGISMAFVYRYCHIFERQKGILNKVHEYMYSVEETRSTNGVEFTLINTHIAVWEYWIASLIKLLFDSLKDRVSM